MHDRSATQINTQTVGNLPPGAPKSLARFILDLQQFEIILCQKDDTRHVSEIIRFDVNGSTVAIIADLPGNGSAMATSELIARLTGRELQIAALVAEGDATKNIAHKLRISEWTVGTHLRRIFAKLNVDNRAAMVYLCAPLIKHIASHRVEAVRPPRAPAAAPDAASLPGKKRHEDLAKA